VKKLIQIGKVAFDIKYLAANDCILFL